MDDSEIVRFTMSEILHVAGFEVTEAATGAEALRQAVEHPDVIILDVHLPDLDGHEVCRRLKAEPGTAAIPILQISGIYVEVNDKVRGLESGADAYLTRSAEPAELIATVKALLRPRQVEAGWRETEEHRQTAEALADVGRVLAHSLDPEEVAQRIADRIRVLFAAEAANVYGVDLRTGEARVLAFAGDMGPAFGPQEVLPPGIGLIGLAMREGRPVVTANLLTEARLTLTADLRRRLEGAPYRAALAVPLVVQGRIIGALGIGDREGRTFADDEIDVATAFADQAAIALEASRLYTEATRRQREAQELARVAQLLTETLDATAVGMRTVESVRQLFGVRLATLWLRQADDTLVAVASAGLVAEPVGPGEVLPPGVGVAGRTVREGRSLRCADVLSEPGIPLTDNLRHALLRTGTRAMLGVPLRVKGQPIGTVTVADEAGREFSEADAALLQAFGDQAALALENARLYEETQQRLQHTETLLAVSHAVGSTMQLTEVGRRTTRELVRALRADIGGAWYLSPDRDQLIPLAGYHLPKDLGAKLSRVPRDHRLLAEARGLEGPIHSSDSQADSRFDHPWARLVPHKSLLLLPMRAKGTVIGGFGVAWLREAHQFTPAELRLAEGIAQQAGVALENAQLLTELATHQSRLETLIELSRQLSALQPVESLLERLAEACGRLLQAEAVGFRLLEGGELVVRGTWGGARESMPTRRLKLGESLSGLVAATGEPLVIRDPANDPRLIPAHQETMRRLGYRAILAVPVKIGERVLGVLSIQTTQEEGFSVEDQATALAFASQAAVALENSRLYREVTEGRDFLRSITDNSANAIVTTDVHGRVTYVSRGAEEMFGYAAEEVLGQPVGRYYAGGPDETRTLMRRLIAEARIRSYETALRAKHGGWIHASLSISLLRDARGKVAGTLTVLMDTTERKRAEMALRESEERFRSAFEHSAVGMALQALGGQYLRVNRALCAMLGYSEAELRGTTYQNLTQAEDLDIDGAHDDQLLTGQLGSYQIEKRYVHKDGHTVWALVTVSVVREAAGPPLYFVVQTQDITTRKQAEAAHAELEAQLRQAHKIEAIGRLAGGVAHDFNNLLTVIKGRSQLLLRRPGLDDRVRRDLELIEKTADRAGNVTQQLLAFSRKQVLQPRVLGLNRLVANLETMLQRLIGEHIQLLTLLSTRLGHVKADPVQLEQVILNLAVNARDAMPEGGVLTLETANVDVDDTFVRAHPGSRRGPHVVLAVTDTGHGMDAATQARLFEPFFTTKGVGRGTGLGLATVYGIVKQSGGYIGVESEPGRGTRFEVYLPRAEELTAEAGAEPTPPSPPGGTETVLVVEDESDVLEVARDLLQLSGYMVLQARDGTEALRVATEHAGSISLLLTDVVMPGMSGRELANQLLAQYPDLKVIYMSGYTDETIGQHGVLERGTAFLQKPFTEDALAWRVREVLDTEQRGR